MSQAETYEGPKGRPLATVVRSDFDDFAAYPPTFATNRERQWLAEHYQVESPELERTTKAHLTADELPLQLTLLARPPGARVKPHYHINDRAPESTTRHQVVICLAGSVRIGLFAVEGDQAGDIVIGPGDLVLLYEGHSIETLETGTRLVEVKQGPMPADPLADNVPVGAAGDP